MTKEKLRTSWANLCNPWYGGLGKKKISSSFTLQFLPHCLFGDPFFLRRQFMATPSRRSVRKYLIQKPNGQVTQRVQAVGPAHFRFLSFASPNPPPTFILPTFPAL